jgi:hypothetical protein
MSGFTTGQLSDWRKYEKVRERGRYNMLTPQARRATGLSEERYSFVLTHYSELRDAALAARGKSNA